MLQRWHLRVLEKEEAEAFATKGLALSPPHKSLESYFGMLGGVLP